VLAEPCDVPRELRDAVRRHVSLLPGTGQDALFVAAVAGPEFSLDVVSLVCDRPIEQVRELLDREVARGVLVEVRAASGLYRFCDAGFRAALYEDLPPSRRGWLERQITQVREATNKSPPQPPKRRSQNTCSQPVGGKR
jgi:predicted ATPase